MLSWVLDEQFRNIRNYQRKSEKNSKGTLFINHGLLSQEDTIHKRINSNDIRKKEMAGGKIYSYYLTVNQKFKAPFCSLKKALNIPLLINLFQVIRLEIVHVISGYLNHTRKWLVCLCLKDKAKHIFSKVAQNLLKIKKKMSFKNLSLCNSLSLGSLFKSF